MPTSVRLRSLLPDDEATVRAWLTDYLCDHVAGWVQAHGLPWTPAQIREHVREHGLVERDYTELVAAIDDPSAHVELALEGSTPLAIVHAEQRVDRYLQIPLGAVSWIYVAPVARRRGIGDVLLQRALAWMRANGLRAAEVFVTRTNADALRSYERAGFVSVDSRMIAAISEP